MTMEDVFYARKSVRAFLPTAVDRDRVEKILRMASRAPSGTNTQPWNVTVLTGKALKGLTNNLLEAAADPERSRKYGEEYPYYPKQWTSPYVERRRKIGFDLYGLLGIGIF